MVAWPDALPRAERGRRAGTRVRKAGEQLAVLLAATAAAIVTQANLLHKNVVEGDVLVHQYWMRSFTDPQLFTDQLTAALKRSDRYPAGYEALFRAASHVADPVAFGEWLGIALMAFAGWLVFRIVREHTAWAPAAWIAAALFLALDTHRFSGGFPRGFTHIIVLSTVLLALRGRHVAAAVVAAAGVLIYPPAALLSVAVLVLAGVRFGRWRLALDRRGVLIGAAALALTAVTAAVAHVASGTSPDFLSAGQARAYPEFGAHGELHFFVPSLIEYLRQNRSGFDLRATGSIITIAALALLALRPANLRLLRPEVLALPIASLACFALAQAVLFRLYLPHRYTYPLVAFFAIAIGVGLRPTWEAIWSHARPRARAVGILVAPLLVWYAALYAFPLGPDRALRPLVSWTTFGTLAAACAAAATAFVMLARLPAQARAAAATLLSGFVLLGALVVAPGHNPPGQTCASTSASAFLASLPKAAVVAGDPIDLKCVPFTARRGVVISTQLAPSYEAGYFHAARRRMFAMLRAYYGPSRAAIARLRRYGATDLWVRRGALLHERAEPRGVRWRRGQQPYGTFVRDVLASGRRPAVLALPARCRVWHSGREAVYDIGCVSADG
jgi:hypothetical protein